MRNPIVAVVICAVIGSAACASAERQQLTLGTAWQAVKLEHTLISDSPPGDDASWQDHDITGLPLPAKVGERCQAWYRCNVNVPADFAGDSIWLKLDNWQAARVACWINGKRLEQEYWTGSLPVEWRVGEHLKAGAENQIVLAFWSVDWARVELTGAKAAKDSEAGKEYRFLLPGAENVGATRYIVPTGYGPPDLTLAFAGPTGPISLEGRSKIFIDNVQAVTDIQPPALTVRTHLKGTTDQTGALTVLSELYDGDQLIARCDEQHPAGGVQETVECAFACPGVRLWWPDDPAMYHLKVRVLDGDVLLDESTVRIGFRTVRAEGRKLLLNGVGYNAGGVAGMALGWARPISYLTKVPLPEAFWLPDKDAVRSVYRFMKSQNVRMARLSQAVYPKVWFDAADEEGFLIISESALCNSGAHQGIELDEFWRHWDSHMLRMVRSRWNHPSIIVWSLGNEVGHGGRGKIAYPRMAKTVRRLKQLDATRLVSCSGDGDVSGAADIVNLHYPQCGPGASNYPGQDYPLSAFWLQDRDVWPGYYGVADQQLKEKPFFIGEWDTLFGHPPQTVACIFGDDAFVGGSPGTISETTFMRNQMAHGSIIRQFVEAYRYNGVVHPSPWTVLEYASTLFPTYNIAQMAEAYRPEMIMLLPTSQCFFGDAKINFTAVTFNDTTTPRDHVATFRLEVADKVASSGYHLWRRTDIPAFQPIQMGIVPPGDKAQKTLGFQIPPVDSRTPIRLNAALNANSATVHHRFFDWSAYPRSGPLEPQCRSAKVAVFDPADTLTPYLRAHGVNVVPIDANLASDSGARVVVLAENSLLKADHRQLRSLEQFVHAGGRVICLQQDIYPGWLPAPLLCTGTQVRNTYNFVRGDNHDVLKGVSNEMLRLWGSDLIVSRSPFMKTDTPGLRYLVDCAVSGFAGMSVASLVELSYGQGSYLLCQMLITDHLASSPGAERLLLNMLRYAIAYEPTAARDLVLCTGDDASWRQRFKEAGVTIDRDAADGANRTVLWCDDPAKLPANTVELVEQGATLVLYDLSPAELPKANELFGLSVAFRPKGKLSKWWFTNKTRQTNLLDGVSNQDLAYFASVQMPGAVWGAIEQVVANPIDVTSQGGLTPACDPVGLCRIAIGDGQVVFCQLNCFATQRYTKKGMRLFRQLAHNLGLAPQAPRVAVAGSAGYSPLDLRRCANSPFRDADPEQANDLREFPLTQDTFAGIRFDIIDPAKNDGRGCVVLKSTHTEKMPAAVAGIAVNRKMSSLAALVSAAWGPAPEGTALATIVLHYEDGTTVSLPIQYKRHVTEWWDPPELLPSARPGWVGGNPVHQPIVVYVAIWSNPEPDKKVTTLDLVSAETSTPVTVIGLTAVSD